MTDEAREAAWSRLLPFKVESDDRVDPRAEIRGLVGRIAFDAGFNAGVAEGIRRAREAARAERRSPVNGYVDIDRLLSAIDALETT